MIFRHLHTQTLACFSLCVLSLRDFHGKLSKEGLFHSPFQPTGEVAGPMAFSISVGSQSPPPTSSTFFGEKSMLPVHLRAGD